MVGFNPVKKEVGGKCGTKGALSDIALKTPAAQAIPIFHYHPVM